MMFFSLSAWHRLMEQYKQPSCCGKAACHPNTKYPINTLFWRRYRSTGNFHLFFFPLWHAGWITVSAAQGLESMVDKFNNGLF